MGTGIHLFYLPGSAYLCQMQGAATFRFTPAVLGVPMVAILLIWAVYWAELHYGPQITRLGIYPRTVSGLPGIFLAPLIHGSIGHLYNNTLPLAILLAALFFFYREIAVKVLVIGIIGSGLFTWAIARPAYHIGASGVIYFLASFMFFMGILSRYYRLVALSLLVAFLYGGMLWYIFPVVDEMSWEGHLGGFLTGLVLAVALRRKLPRQRQFAWEKEDYREDDDPFMRHFDADGNFVEDPGPEEGETGPPPLIKYHYRERKPDDGSGQPPR